MPDIEIKANSAGDGWDAHTTDGTHVTSQSSKTAAESVARDYLAQHGGGNLKLYTQDGRDFTSSNVDG